MSAPADNAADDVEVIEPQQGGGQYRMTPQAAAALMQAAGGNPALMELMQAKLDNLIGSSSGFIESLPKKVRRRISFLEELQEKHDELQEQFEEELAALEEKYRKQYEPLYEKRKAIVTGKEEAPPPAEGAQGEAEEASKEGEAEEEEVPSGVPQFWLNVLRNNEDFAEVITEKDEAVLEHLIDISAEELGAEPKAAEGKGDDDEEEDEEEHGFKLTFTFEPNEFFSETVLTKTYHMAPGGDAMLESVEGCPITWAAGKNPRVKLMKKKPKKGAKPGAKPQTKLEPVPSFFDFFDPPEVPEDGEELEEEDMAQLQAALEQDYELGNTIKEDLIPRAVSWYTGDAVGDDDDDEDEYDDDEEAEEDEEDDEDDDEDDDDEGDEAAPKRRAGGTKGRTGAAPANAKEPECKQQ